MVGRRKEGKKKLSKGERRRDRGGVGKSWVFGALFGTRKILLDLKKRRRERRLEGVSGEREQGGTEKLQSFQVIEKLELSKENKPKLNFRGTSKMKKKKGVREPRKRAKNSLGVTEGEGSSCYSSKTTESEASKSPTIFFTARTMVECLNGAKNKATKGVTKKR